MLIVTNLLSEQGPWVPPNNVSSDDDQPNPGANSQLVAPNQYVESTSSFNPPRPPESR